MTAAVRKPILYAADVSPLTDSVLYAAAYDMASPRRREKTDCFRRREDRCLSLGAELMLRIGLQEAGVAEFPETFEIGPNGKPYLQGTEVYFNLAHSGRWAICAVADCEVGCDLEELRPVNLKIAKRFFTPREYAEIASLPTAEEQYELFFRYWTLKESFMKVTGLGMKLLPNAFQILPGERVSVLQNVDDRGYDFAEFTGIPGYRCALCATGPCRDAELRIVDLKEHLMGPRAGKTDVIWTERLQLVLLSDEAMEQLVRAETDEGLRLAYTEMLEGSRDHPNLREWYAIWEIRLREDPAVCVGSLSFKGLSAVGSAEIGYGIDPAQQRQGYAAEAVTAMVQWAISQPQVSRIEAETEPDNLPSRRVLEKAGFVPTGKFGEEGPRFVLNNTSHGNENR